jgi:hypothetical protein
VTHAFRIQIDGKTCGDFSDSEFSNQSFTLTLISPFEGPYSSDQVEFKTHLGGLTKEDAEGHSYHYRWPLPKIGLGTVVTIEVVESDNCIPAPVRHRSDNHNPLLEEMYTADEIREMRYQDYLDLKKEFEKQED